MMNGYKPPSNSRMKKEISIDSISGYFEYTGRDEAKDVVKEVEENETGYFGYTGSHTVGTSSSMATLNTREDRKNSKKKLKSILIKKVISAGIWLFHWKAMRKQQNLALKRLITGIVLCLMHFQKYLNSMI